MSHVSGTVSGHFLFASEANRRLTAPQSHRTRTEKRRYRGLIISFAVLFLGCSESVYINSSPPGAKVFVNESLIGTTPALFTVERSQLKPSFPLRLEKDGYEPYEGEIRSRVAGGRATAAFFTLGIVYLFRSPRYLAFPEMVNLEPSLEAETDRRLGRQLRELEELLDEGRITREEYETRRRRLFGEP